MLRLRTPILVAVAFMVGIGATTLAQTATQTVTLSPGESVLVVADDVATTEPEPTVPPTTEPEPTVPPTTEPEPTVPHTTELPQAAGFTETFDANAGLDRFDYGVYHRGDDADGNSAWPGATTWPGDHSVGVDGADCGSPDTQRTINRNTEEWIYVCRNHLMTAIGDTDGYSTGYFQPRQTFTTERTVSWDVNVTDLGGRQWFEVSIVPASFASGVPRCPQCSAHPDLASVAGLPAHPAGSIVVSNIARGLNVTTDGVDRQVKPHYIIAYLDPEGAASKAIRRPFSITDNGNGTMTVDFGGFDSFTVPGSFPDEYVVVFKDHNYTPDKDGLPDGYTWHWDSIVIR